MVAGDISSNVIRLSNNQTFNFIGDLNIDGNINMKTDISGQVGRILNNYTLKNSKVNDSSLNNTTINNSLIGFTNPSQAIFTDVSTNNLAIENDIIINNNVILKNIEENEFIYATIVSNNSHSNHTISYDDFNEYLNIDIFYDSENSSKRLNKYKFYLEKNNKYYFQILNNQNVNMSIGLYIKDISNIIISTANAIYPYNNKNFYVYDKTSDF